MKMSKIVVRVLLASLTLALLLTFAEMVVERELNFTAFSGWLLVGSLMITIVLSLVVLGAQRGGWELALTVFGLYFGLRYLNTFDELLIFKIGVSDLLARHEVLRGLLASLLFAPILVWLLGRWSAPAEPNPEALAPRSIWGWTWRIVAGDFAYVFFYIVAGMIIWPFIKDFYAKFVLPSPGTVLSMQVFRGLVFVLVALGVTRLMAARPGRAALALAIAFPVLGGLEALIYPNPIMPGHIRFPHSIEIGWSNAAYGIVLGFLLTRRAAAKEQPAAKPVAAAQAA